MTIGRRGWIAAHFAVVAAFLVVVATYYHAPYGFTEFIHFPVDPHNEYELAAISRVPHVENHDGGYDGQFYARLAVDPFLINPAIDKTLDEPGYRARRILFSWTAYIAGLGRPAWVIEAFALQNVVAWLVMAWLLLRWLPVGSARTFALWCGCLLTHGMLSSVGNALLDAPSAVLLAAAIVATEQGRPWLATLVFAVSGLARETNLLGTTMLARFVGPSAKSIWRGVAWIAIALVPTLLWTDYLRSIYRHGSLATAGAVTTPLVGLFWKMSTIVRDLKSSGITLETTFNISAVIAFVTQVIFIAWLAANSWRERAPWLLLAASFGVLGLFAHPVVWAGAPGAITRVALPMTLGFNILACRRSWLLLVLGNLAVFPGVMSFVFRM